MKYLIKPFRTGILTFMVLVGIASSALAQDIGMAGMKGMTGMTHSKNAFVSIMDTMMVKMGDVPKKQSPSKTFMIQMIPHHEGAIAMANYEILHGKDFAMIQLAKSIKAEQQSECLQMHLLIKQLNTTEAASPHLDNEIENSMKIMMNNMPVEKSLKDTDHAFAKIMLPHHQAAIDMARVLLKYPGNDQVLAFARQMISEEQIEIEQMLSYLNK